MKYLGLIVVIVIAIAAAFFVLQASQPAPAPSPSLDVSNQAEPAIEEVSIYVAARDIPIGSVIDANMLTTRPWPAHLVVEGFVVGAEEGQKIIQTVARAPFRRNEPINKSKLVNPKDPNFLAGELPKGMRLVTMSADEISAVAGFVFPGDRVDVLVTHRILKDGLSQKEIDNARSEMEITEEVTEVLLQDIRVMAVDQRSTGGVDEEDGIIIPRSISLEVTPENAQRLRLGQEVGELSLALRSVEDKDAVEAVAITRQADLSQFAASTNTDKEEAPSDDEPVRVIRGTKVEVLEEE